MVNNEHISNFQNNKMVNLDEQIELAGTFLTGSYTDNFASSGTPRYSRLKQSNIQNINQRKSNPFLYIG